MDITLLGVKWDLIAIVVFMFVWVLSTQLVKPLLKKNKTIKKWMRQGDWFNLLLSWFMSGLTYYFIIMKLMKIEPSTASIIQFSFIILFVNGGYKAITVFKNLFKDLNSLGD